MPLPKLPSKPATILATQDYPTAGAARPATKTPAAKKVAAPIIEAAIAEVAKPVRNAATKIKQVAALMVAKPAPAPAVAAPAAPAPAPAKAAPAAKGKVTPIKSVKQVEQPHPAKHKAVEVQLKSSASRAADQRGISKLFVLDTNVLMHDPSSLFRFEEHDVYLPMMTLEELDNHKKGMTEVARNARQVSRTLDALISNTDDDAIEHGILLSKLGNKDAKGRLFFQTRLQSADLPAGLPVGKADNQILAVDRKSVV